MADLPSQTEQMISHLSHSPFPDVYPEASENTVTDDHQEDAPLVKNFAGPYFLPASRVDADSFVRIFASRGFNEGGTHGS